MKTIKPFILALTFVLTTLSLSSCLDDDDNYPWPDGSLHYIATLKPLGSGDYYLQLDDSTTFIPTNSYTPHFGADEEQRVYAILSREKENVQGYTTSGSIFLMDSILTKPIAENLLDRNDEIYGKDPVEMFDIWVEDGYLSFEFVTYYGDTKKHFVNVIQPDSANAPYELEFRHNAYDDPRTIKARGLVSFKLDQLPDTEGKTVKMKIKWHSFTGEKTYELNYSTRKSSGEKARLSGFDNFKSLQ